jgi:hypothetical protein
LFSSNPMGSVMINRLLSSAAIGALAFAAPVCCNLAFAQHASLGDGYERSGEIRHVLLISIDGMHALDFSNCANGVNGGPVYCPRLAELAKNGLTYTQASASKPSDSFPGLTALVTGGSSKSTGAFYDVSYDRALSPPAKTTPYGIVGGAALCPAIVGTQIGFDEEIDIDLTKLNAGGGIDPGYLPRDPKNGCAPVYPHSFIRVNTMFEVVKAAGGYTAWSDKHQSYELTKGRSGDGLNDFYAPEINSIPVALPQVTRLSCNPLPDRTAVSSSNAWTDSFANIKCYDTLKVQAILNEIDGLDHTGAEHTRTPNLFGMNFQAVSVGEKLVESSVNMTGGYLDAAGTPSAALQDEIKFVDAAIGAMVDELKARGRYDSTAIIVTAKHGQSPIDPKRVLRIPHDDPSKAPPSSFLGVTQALEDDVSLLWLSDRSASGIANAVSTLEAHAATIGADGGAFYYGPGLGLMFNNGPSDSRTPDIIVAPNVGVVYTGGGKKVAEHGGFAHDDTNVMMLVANPKIEPRAIFAPVQTAQVAPTILKLLGLDPQALDAVRAEGTEVLPGVGDDRHEDRRD